MHCICSVRECKIGQLSSGAKFLFPGLKFSNFLFSKLYNGMKIEDISMYLVKTPVHKNKTASSENILVNFRVPLGDMRIFTYIMDQKTMYSCSVSCHISQHKAVCNKNTSIFKW